MFSLGRDPASEHFVRTAIAATAITAAGGGDNTAINGLTIDLLTERRCEAVEFILNASAVLADTRQLNVAYRVQDSADGSTWADVVGGPTGTLNLTDPASPGTGSTMHGAVAYDISVEYCRRYVRTVVTPDLSAAGTDTAIITAVAIFQSPDRLP